jgi:hypothetical protein
MMADRMMSSLSEDHLLSLMLLGGRYALHHMRSEWSRRTGEDQADSSSAKLTFTPEPTDPDAPHAEVMMA